MQSERGDLRTACAANLTGAGLKDKGMVSRGWIGVQIQPVTSDIAEVLGLKGPGGPSLPSRKQTAPLHRRGSRPRRPGAHSLPSRKQTAPLPGQAFSLAT